MKTFCKWGLNVSIISFLILHFFTYFYENHFLLYLLSISGLCLFIFAVITYTPKRIKMPFTLFIVGMLVLFISQTGFFFGLLNGMLQMRNMIGLIAVIPLIGWVLQGEPYMEAIMSTGYRFLNTGRKFYFGMLTLTQVIAYFLMFGAIPMMHQFENWVLADKQGEAWEHFKGTAVLRGFSLAVMWVITIPSFAFVVEVMGASLWMAILQGVVISVCGTVVALVFTHFEKKKYGVDITSGLQEGIAKVLRHSDNEQEMNRYVIEFIILFVSLFSTIFILHAVTSIALLVLIPLVVVGWVLAYFIVKGRLNTLAVEAKRYVNEEMVPQSYQLCVMLGAGMMILGLNQIGFADVIVNGLYSLQEHVPFINVLHILPFMVIILGFFGLGPLTVMVFVGEILQSIQLPYPAELVVLAITSGSAISILLSPLIMPLIVLSGSNGLSGIKNGIVFNWKFAIAIYVMVQIYIQGIVWLPY